MANNYYQGYNTDEILCLYNSVRESLELYQFVDKSEFLHTDFEPENAEQLRVELGAEIERRPDSYDDPEPWTFNAPPNVMSANAIQETPLDTLQCFVICITKTLEYLDDESQFHTRVSVSMTFARSLRTAIGNELARRSENPPQ